MGHISPLGAYDATADRFLVLDVARYEYPPVWVDTATLFAAMSTDDFVSGKTRGFVTVSPSAAAPGPRGRVSRGVDPMRTARTPLLAVGLLVGCHGAPSAAHDGGPRPSPVASPPPVASAPEPECPPPRPGETTDDDTPSVRGVSGDAGMLDWLSARGAGKGAALAWLDRTFALRHAGDPGWIEGYVAPSACSPLRVGDPAEEALFCAIAIPSAVEHVHAVILVARRGVPVAVLDVGLSMPARDWPEARWLDLALAVAPDGLSVDLRDRARDGTVLVPPSSACRAHSGRMRATLHDCTGGRARFVAMEHEAAAGGGPMATEARDDVAFFDRACRERGSWIWKGDRFLKAP